MIERHRYEEDLAEDARGYHRSFMDVSGIEDRAAKKAKSELKGVLFIGGALVAVLVAWASLEPVVSKWIWEKTGFVSATQRAEDVRLLKDIQNEQAVLKLLAIIGRRSFLNSSRIGLIDDTSEFEAQVLEVAVGDGTLL